MTRGKEFSIKLYEEAFEFDHLSPSEEVLKSLTGDVSNPKTVQSFKPWGINPPISEEERKGGGRLIEGVSLVESGPGLWGLTDWEDNKTWSGILNHIWLMTRAALYLAKKVTDRTQATVNFQNLIDAGLSSHSGRRVWDEANWYPYDVEDSEELRSVSNETLGLRIIKGQISDGAFNIVAALGHNVEGFEVNPTVYETLEYRLAVYADHRIAQSFGDLPSRLAYFLFSNFIPSEEKNDEKLIELTKAFRIIVDRRKVVDINSIDNDKDLALAESEILELGANSNSTRLSLRDFLQLLLNDADTEAYLERLDIDISPSGFNEEAIQMPSWEEKMRSDYVGFAADSINKQIESDLLLINNSASLTIDLLEDHFPTGTWWGNHVWENYIQSD